MVDGCFFKKKTNHLWPLPALRFAFLLSGLFLLLAAKFLPAR